MDGTFHVRCCTAWENGTLCWLYYPLLKDLTILLNRSLPCNRQHTTTVLHDRTTKSLATAHSRIIAIKSIIPSPAQQIDPPYTNLFTTKTTSRSSRARQVSKGQVLEFTETRYTAEAAVVSIVVVDTEPPIGKPSNNSRISVIY